MVAQRLFTERFDCVLRSDHPALGKTQRALDLETFTRLSHVQIAPRGTRGGMVDELLARRGKTRHVALRVADFLVAPLVVAGSDLVLTVPERVARVFAGTHGLRVVEPPLDIPGFTMWQIWHARRKQEPAHVWLRGLLAQAVVDHDASSRRRRPSLTARAG
jgi:DNA-binding transcriptional LysR family regulator